MLSLWCHIYFEMMHSKRIVVRIFRMGKLGQKFCSPKLAGVWLVTWLKPLASWKWTQRVLSQIRFRVLWIMGLPKMTLYCLPLFCVPDSCECFCHSLSFSWFSPLQLNSLLNYTLLETFLFFYLLICHWLVLVCHFICYNWQTKLLNTLNFPLMN